MSERRGMAEMAVERYAQSVVYSAGKRGAVPLIPVDDGPWVGFDDYEQLQSDHQALRDSLAEEAKELRRRQDNHHDTAQRRPEWAESSQGAANAYSTAASRLEALLDRAGGFE